MNHSQEAGRTEEFRPLFFLGGWKKIGTTFGLSSRKAREWYDKGAPIIMVGEKPVAEAGELWRWLREEYG